MLGYWKHSSVPDPEHKHAVFCHITHNGRLRNKTQQTDCNGKPIPARYPGSRVRIRFSDIALADHLIGVNRIKIGMYVRDCTALGQEIALKLLASRTKAAPSRADQLLATEEVATAATAASTANSGASTPIYGEEANARYPSMKPTRSAPRPVITPRSMVASSTCAGPLANWRACLFPRVPLLASTAKIMSSTGSSPSHASFKRHTRADKKKSL